VKPDLLRPGLLSFGHSDDAADDCTRNAPNRTT
jgi:hypothetical protein